MPTRAPEMVEQIRIAYALGTQLRPLATMFGVTKDEIIALARSHGWGVRADKTPAAAMIEIPRDAPDSVACGRSGLPPAGDLLQRARRLVPLVPSSDRPGLDAVLLQQECRLAATSACRVWSGGRPGPGG
jgi:hypothetical protein